MSTGYVLYGGSFLVFWNPEYVQKRLVAKNIRGGSMKLLFSITFLATMLLSSVFMQNAEAVEKINVIGSHIKRVQAEGPSPILIIDRRQIEMSPHQSVADLLRDLPVATSGTARGSSIISPSTFTYSSLRGMGGDEVLVLINKVRVVPAGGRNIVDLNVLPLVAIERIEILKDGSSALYGADAIGGVINIVTRRNFKGIKVSTQGSLAQREEGNTFSGLASFVDFWDWERKDFSGKGDQLNVEAVYGGDKGDINYLLAGQIRMHTPLYFRDRSFGKPAIEDFSPVGSPGSWKTEGALNWNPAPDCPANRINDGLCTFDSSPYPQFTPQEINAKAFLHAAKPLGVGVLESQTIYSLVRPHTILAPAPGSFSLPRKPGDPDYRIPPSTFSNMLQRAASQGGGTSGVVTPVTGPVTMLYRMVDEKGAGVRETVSWNHFLQTQVRYIQPVRDTMEFEGNVSASGYYYANRSYNYLNKGILFTSLQDGTFNPLLPKEKKNDVSKARYEPVTRTFSGLVNVEPRLSGEWLEIKGQPLFFATGALGGWQYYSDYSDEITVAGKQWGGGVANTGSGSRGFGSVYGELSSVIASQAELQVAARTDYYEGFGLAWQEWDLPFTEISVPSFPFSPKAAMSWQPVNQLKLRASWGLGFKVPTLSALFQDEIVTHPYSRDMFLCTDEYYKTHKDSKECQEGTQYKTFLRSNKNLKPELTESVNIGLVLQPVEQFSLSMDYYSINQHGGTRPPGLRRIFEYEAKHGLKKLKDDLDMEVKRDAAGKVEYVVARPVNASRSKLHGAEFDVILRVPTGRGWYAGFKVEHSHLFYMETQATPASDIKTFIPFYGWMKNLFGVEDGEQNRKTNLTYPTYPRWRNRATISFQNKDLGQEYQLIVHNIPSQLQAEDSPADEIIDHYWQLDVSGSWQLDRRSEIIFGVNNVLGLDRPRNPKRHDGIGGYIDSFLYSLRGRTLNMRYTYRF